VSNALRILAGLLIVEAISAAVIGGRVIEDHSGHPVTSAEVKIRLAGARMLSADLETDAEGRFQTPEIPDGEYRIAISKPNYAVTSLNLNTKGASPLFVRLIRGGAVQGVVMDRDGQPVTSASVFAISKLVGSATLKRVLMPGRHATTDAKGQYRLYNLAPGRYVIVVSYGASTTAVGSSGSAATSSRLGSGFQFYPENPRPRVFEITGGEQHHNIDFSLESSAVYSVSGKVELPEAKGTFWLALTSVEQTAMASAIAQTNAEGHFNFTNVPAGSYHLFASGPSRARSSHGAHLDKDPYFARTRLDLTQNVEGLTIAVDKGRSLSAQLSVDPSSKLDPACAKVAQLVLSSLEDWGSQLETKTSIDFAKPASVASLAPARYSATVSGLAAGCHVAREIAVDLSGSSTPSISIPISSPGNIRGLLQNASSGTTVGLAPEDGSAPVSIAIPNAEARFEFSALQPGRYRIWTQSSKAEPASGSNTMEIEVRGGTTVDVNLSSVMAPAR